MSKQILITKAISQKILILEFYWAVRKSLKILNFHYSDFIYATQTITRESLQGIINYLFNSFRHPSWMEAVFCVLALKTKLNMCFIGCVWSHTNLISFGAGSFNTQMSPIKTSHIWSSNTRYLSSHTKLLFKPVKNNLKMQPVGADSSKL